MLETNPGHRDLRDRQRAYFEIMGVDPIADLRASHWRKPMNKTSTNPIPAVDTVASDASPDTTPAVADLAVECTDRIKGGPLGGTTGGSTRLNHNEAAAMDEEPEPKVPADLPAPSGDEVKGGPSGTSTTGGSTRLNHNETSALDDSI